MVGSRASEFISSYLGKQLRTIIARVGVKYILNCKVNNCNSCEHFLVSSQSSWFYSRCHCSPIWIIINRWHFSLQINFLPAGAHATTAGPAIRHVPGDREQCESCRDWNDKRSTGRVGRPQLLPYVRERRKDSPNGRCPEI